jgi:uncharacterized protein DUF6600
MNRFIKLLLILPLLLLGFSTVHAGVAVNVGVGSNDYYQPVGDYDYLPYAYQTNPGYTSPQINFHDMMSQYGVWVSVAPFGQVWKPYASNDWRPYTQGHWVATQQYGQMWEGYEPWAWAGYHYGNWIYTPNYGWVWIPGYDWHAGRVTWARSYDSIGWSPTPPNGYDYSRGYLSNVGPYNQYSYNDNDFSMQYGNGNFGYGGPYYDPRYRNMYYNQPYNNISFNLWFFISNSHYGYDNYSNYYLGRDYTRHIFDRRLVRITNRQIDRTTFERVIGQRIRETPVEVRQFQADKRTIRVVVPTGNDDIERIRKNSKEVVRDVIAPGFAEKQKTFKGQNSKNKDVVSRIFHQENVAPKVENLSSDQILNQARETSQKREQNRVKLEQAEREKLVRIEKEGKLQEPVKEKNTGEKQNTQKQNEAAKVKQHDVQKQNDNAKRQQEQDQKDKWKMDDMQSSHKEPEGKEVADKNQIDSSKNSKVKDNKPEPDKKAQEKSKEKKAQNKHKDNSKNNDQPPPSEDNKE